MNVLIADDEKNLRESLAELIESEGFNAFQASDGEEALEFLREAKAKPDVIFLDLKMPRLGGLELLEIIRREKLSGAPIIVISAFGESSKMIEAMRLGAYDYINKPLDLDEILAILQRAAEQRSRSLKIERVSNKKDESEDLKVSPRVEIIGSSRAMREIFKQIGKFSATDATILITGESGTGKELVARSIHQHSARASKPFIALNCGALPENLIESELFGYERGAFTGAERQKKGRFELADKGTLFLDEIGELTLNAQVKLLRVLQERRFERVGGSESVNIDVRVIAATNRDLKKEIEAKNFREDLYYRLSVIELHLPPLRERIADVPLLAEYFLEKSVARHKLKEKFISEDALRALLAHNFRGNVRELENMIERAAIVSNSETILPEQLFPNNEFNGAEEAASASSANHLLKLPFHQAIAALERELIARALQTSGGNRSEAAKVLGINRRLLYSKLDEHKIK